MGTICKTITLTDKQDDWIKAQIKAGHYIHDSEYLRDLIRRQQERSADIDAIRAALTEGETSAEARSFDAVTFWKRMQDLYGSVPSQSCCGERHGKNLAQYLPTAEP